MSFCVNETTEVTHGYPCSKARQYDYWTLQQPSTSCFSFPSPRILLTCFRARISEVTTSNSKLFLLQMFCQSFIARLPTGRSNWSKWKNSTCCLRDALFKWISQTVDKMKISLSIIQLDHPVTSLHARIH